MEGVYLVLCRWDDAANTALYSGFIALRGVETYTFSAFENKEYGEILDFPAIDMLRVPIHRMEGVS
jgi:hypothetical protein